MTRFWGNFCSLFVLALSISAGAQERLPFGHIRRGTIVSISFKTGTISLKEEDGIARSYLLLDRVFFRKKREEALLQDFRAGEKVTVQVRLNRNNSTYELLGVMDSSSYQWLSYLRATVLNAPITALEENRLVLQVQGHSVRYVVDDKTRWYLRGREVGKQSFQIGDSVWVYPESLTRGEVLARGVGGAKEDLISQTLSDEYNVRGTLQEIDMGVGTVRLRLKDGVEQVWRFVSVPQLRQRSKTVTEEQMQVAIEQKLPICLRLRRYPHVDYVVRITIEKTERHPKIKSEREIKR